MSSPRAVINFELIPSLDIFSAIFFPTPPNEMPITPGFES